jgi:hypothetical protein
MKITLIAALLGVLCFTPLVAAQEQRSTEASAAQRATVTGTVVRLRPGALTVRTDDDRYLVFALTRDTVRPATLATGARVEVESIPRDGDEEGARTATAIRVSDTAPTGSRGSGASATIPPAIRQLERDIEANVRRYRAGIRGGVALDPELVTLGAHATFGPIFTPRLLMRPNVEFAYGELTTLFAVNLEGIYRLTPTLSRHRWSPYAGGGATLGFSHRGLTAEGDDGRSFDFDDFDFNGGLSLLAGVERSAGAFIELKATIYTEPTVRLLFGYTF